MILLPQDMYDAIPSLVLGIPSNAAYVAGYVDSIHYTWPQSAWDRFPNAVKVTISTTGNKVAKVGDCESGDMTPNQLVDWVLKCRAHNVNAIGYCALGNWNTCQQAFNSRKVPQPPWWVAHYDGKRDLPTLNGITAIAKQYMESTAYDLSCITDTFVQIVTGSTPTVVPIPAPRKQMFLIQGGPDRFNTRAMTDGFFKRNLLAEEAAIDGPFLLVKNETWDWLENNTNKMLEFLSGEKSLVNVPNQLTLGFSTIASQVSNINLSTLEGPLQQALKDCGWTPAPSASENAAAVAPAIIDLLTKHLQAPAS